MFSLLMYLDRQLCIVLCDNFSCLVILLVVWFLFVSCSMWCLWLVSGLVCDYVFGVSCGLIVWMFCFILCSVLVRFLVGVFFSRQFSMLVFSVCCRKFVWVKVVMIIILIGSLWWVMCWVSFSLDRFGILMLVIRMFGCSCCSMCYVVLLLVVLFSILIFGFRFSSVDSVLCIIVWFLVSRMWIMWYCFVLVMVGFLVVMVWLWQLVVCVWLVVCFCFLWIVFVGCFLEWLCVCVCCLVCCFWFVCCYDYCCGFVLLVCVFLV